MTSYRYPGEYFVLTITLLLVFAVVAITAVATLCTGLVFVVLAVFLAYASSRSHHHALLQQAYPITAQTAPDLAQLVQRCMERLQVRQAEVFVTRSPVLNAYTFGLETPRVLVLYSSLLSVMDADELSFVVGHELGHIALGHTWLNSLVGGMAGIPSSSMASTILTMVFLWWNRTCELSADRAGLLACGNLDKATTALVKLVAGEAGLTRAGLEQAYRQIDAEDDTFLGSLNESLASHPMIIRRINELRRWAATEDYRRLAANIK